MDSSDSFNLRPVLLFVKRICVNQVHFGIPVQIAFYSFYAFLGDTKCANHEVGVHTRRIAVRGGEKGSRISR